MPNEKVGIEIDVDVDDPEEVAELEKRIEQLQKATQKLTNQSESSAKVVQKSEQQKTKAVTNHVNALNTLLESLSESEKAHANKAVAIVKAAAKEKIESDNKVYKSTLDNLEKEIKAVKATSETKVRNAIAAAKELVDIHKQISESNEKELKQQISDAKNAGEKKVAEVLKNSQRIIDILEKELASTRKRVQQQMSADERWQIAYNDRFYRKTLQSQQSWAKNLRKQDLADKKSIEEERNRINKEYDDVAKNLIRQSIAERKRLEKELAAETKRIEAETAASRKKSADQLSAYLKKVGTAQLRTTRQQTQQRVRLQKQAARDIQNVNEALMDTAAHGLRSVGFFGERIRRNIIEGGVAMEDLEDSFSALSTTLTSSQIIDRLVDLSKLPGLTFDQAATSAKRLLGAGLEFNKIVPLVREVGNAVALTGSEYGDLWGILRQVTQTISKNKAEMEDLNAINERAPKIAEALRQEFGDLGTSGKELTDAVHEAYGTFREFWPAFANKVLAQQARKSLDTASNAMENLQTSVDLMYKALGKQLLPEIKFVTNALSDMADTIEDLPGPIQKVISYIGVLGPSAAKAGAGILESATNFGLLAVTIRAFQGPGKFATSWTGKFVNIIGKLAGILPKATSAVLAWVKAFGAWQALLKGGVITGAALAVVSALTATAEASQSAEDAIEELNQRMHRQTGVQKFNSDLDETIEKLDEARRKMAPQQTNRPRDVAFYEAYTDPITGESGFRGVAPKRAEKSRQLVDLENQIVALKNLKIAEDNLDTNRRLTFRERVDERVKELTDAYYELRKQGIEPTAEAIRELAKEYTPLRNLQREWQTDARKAAEETKASTSEINKLLLQSAEFELEDAQASIENAKSKEELNRAILNSLHALNRQSQLLLDNNKAVEEGIEQTLRERDIRREHENLKTDILKSGIERRTELEEEFNDKRAKYYNELVKKIESSYKLIEDRSEQHYQFMKDLIEKERKARTEPIGRDARARAAQEALKEEKRLLELKRNTATLGVHARVTAYREQLKLNQAIERMSGVRAGLRRSPIDTEAVSAAKTVSAYQDVVRIEQAMLAIGRINKRAISSKQELAAATKLLQKQELDGLNKEEQAYQRKLDNVNAITDAILDTVDAVELLNSTESGGRKFFGVISQVLAIAGAIGAAPFTSGTSLAAVAPYLTAGAAATGGVANLFHDPSRDRIAELAAARLSAQNIGNVRRNLNQSATDFSNSFAKGFNRANNQTSVASENTEQMTPVIIVKIGEDEIDYTLEKHYKRRELGLAVV